jgi:hypothetical protein
MNNKLNSEMSAGTAADKSGEAEITMSSHSSANTFVGGSTFYDALIAKCKSIVECDEARISKPLDTMFFIIGFKKNTKQDIGTQTFLNGKQIDFDYLQENVIASGKTEDELIASVKEYKKLCGMSWEEYILSKKI